MSAALENKLREGVLQLGLTLDDGQIGLLMDRCSWRASSAMPV